MLAALQQTGELDNTVIVFLADNGAEGRATCRCRGAEGRVSGADNSLDDRGAANSYVNYGAGWAQAATAPSWRYKTFATEGGIRTPASSPGRRSAAAASSAPIRIVADIVPTLLDLAGVPVEQGTFDGRAVQPIDGLSWKGI